MKTMRFAVGFDRIKDRTKTVTRRIGIRADLHRGDILLAIPVGRVRDDAPAVLKVLSVRHEPLQAILDPEYGAKEVALEGFPDLTPVRFVAMFIELYGDPYFPLDRTVTRIEFEYLGDAAKEVT